MLLWSWYTYTAEMMHLHRQRSPSPARTMRGKHQTLQESVLVKHAVWHCLHRDSRSYLHRMEWLFRRNLHRKYSSRCLCFDPYVSCLLIGRSNHYLRGWKCRSPRYGQISGTCNLHHLRNGCFPLNLARHSIPPAVNIWLAAECICGFMDIYRMRTVYRVCKTYEESGGKTEISALGTMK